MQPENASLPASASLMPAADCDIAFLKDKISATRRRRNLTLIGVTSAYCAGILFTGHLDPDFFHLGGIAISIAFIWSVTAIGDIYVTRILVRLAIAILIEQRKAFLAGQA